MNTNDKVSATDRISIGASLLQADGLTATGRVNIKLFDPATGIVVEERDIKNLVVTLGKALIASRLAGNAVAAGSHIAQGSNAAAPAVGQTTLVAETARSAVSTATSAANVATFVATIPAGTGTGNVEEIGLFNATPAGTMIARALTGTILKPAGLALQFTWEITIN